MATVRSIKNQYRGINPHLHSHWQSKGGWDSFHVLHIGDLTKTLNTQLVPMGYIADIQQSLQIRRFGEPAGKPEADVTIYDVDRARPRQPPPASVINSHQLVLTLPEVIDLEEEISEYKAISIYEFDSATAQLGEPVAWIELLSPSNKPGGQDADYFRKKRLKLLESHLVYVEIDYLHESPPTFNKLPIYQARGKKYTPQSNAHPYRIIIIDPRPTLTEGQVFAYQFDVDDPISLVDIPLNAGDVLHYDFSIPYQKTFTEMLYGLNYVNYAELPLKFDRYSEADQLRIVRRMLTILQAAAAGQDLEQAPLPIPASLNAISLLDGLQLLQQYQTS